jgi:ribonucleoside-diphosphate reductase alpha chain
MGWKTAYYQNTYDIKTDEVVEEKPNLQSLLQELSGVDESICESCAV